MKNRLTFRQRVLNVLASLHGLGYKEIGGRTGRKPEAVFDLLQRPRKTEIKDADYEDLLKGVTLRRAEVWKTESYLASILVPDHTSFSERVEASMEDGLREADRLLRTICRVALARASSMPPEEDYLHAFELPIARQRAEKQFAELKRLHRASRLAVIWLNKDYQNWALLERCCEASVEEVSRDLREAAAWARLALAIGKWVRGPEGWRNRNRGYALAHWANFLKVLGELNAADSCLERGKRLWAASADPAGVFDPGRLLDIEGSLRRDQRRFDEALLAFDRAEKVSRIPERSLIMKATAYELMGDNERAIATLVEAEPLVERRGDPRLTYARRFNLAVAFTHAGRFAHAAALLNDVREVAAALGDSIIAARVLWLEGRILAGLKQPGEALRLLARARQKFAAEKMFYDVALALLEEAILLLDQNRTEEVKAITLELKDVFASKGVHAEALAALRLFRDAAEREAATAELARGILRYLFQARHNRAAHFAL